jgi:hypothetical protein
VAITGAAKQNHDELFPGHVFPLRGAIPSSRYFDNFA